jgi:hypothetical protein
MELKKLQQSWDNFPELSMEERPVLSSDLEKSAVKNPLSDAFYLRNKLLLRIVCACALLLLNIWQLQAQFSTDDPGRFEQAALFLVLGYFIYFHVRLLLYADYKSILALRLIPFLGKIETVLEKYIYSFGILSLLGGLYLLAILEKGLSLLQNNNAYTYLSGSFFYKWLIIVFLSVSFYILFLNVSIPRYKKLLAAVKTYKDGILADAQKK